MTSKGKGGEVGRNSKEIWVYVGGPDSRKPIDAPLVAWEDRKAPLRTVTTLTQTKPGNIPVDIPKEVIEKEVILAGVLTLVDKEDPELTPGPSNPRCLDPNPDPIPGTRTANTNNEMSSDKGNKLKDFDGTRSKYQEWIYEYYMYILANPTKYTTDMDKILMVLSYMREGTALLMGKCSADEFVTDYLMTAGESGFDLESTVNYFRRAIYLEIFKQIYRLPEMPTTIDDWWRELQSIKSSVPTTMPRHNNPFCYDFSNAPTSMNNSVVPMAIDSIHTPLTDDERARLRAEGGVSSRVHEGGTRHVQQGSREVGYRPAQTGRALAGRGGGYGRALPARAQISGETATSGKSRSVVMTNLFWARLAVH
ncbi:hypothetical protein HETIRDRAFT_423601 [Heterobasidion irregulare TC 32-1]|uniref:Uncharacterized protein n=1 Tax=Heterobasidion irregulare (strain TC 32-1) TaxID=747525 RepID=W4JNA2_HETIT|nr:uncharacterized protein HETIRDRAFT_423601 [Heterobasidion irregulare TC 32-1]ETW75018.1 hypothetical protein HETIRDRAFT_423601 [Heterobasidion irregulare TC 32-1]